MSLAPIAISFSPIRSISANFDSVPEGSLPSGWTEKGYSTPINEALDFGDLGSAAYRTWTAVNTERFAGSFVTYGNAGQPQPGAPTTTAFSPRIRPTS